MRSSLFKGEQIAPCGMNCGVCSAYLAFSHSIPKKRGKITHCSGCRARKKSCAYLKMHCRPLSSGEVSFCYECRDFPCERLEHIDKRYRTTYGASLIGNLKEIRDAGIDSFLRNQTKAFLCRRCRKDAVSIHNKKCFRCDTIVSWRTEPG
jgi:hypothetical protein